MKSQKIKSLKLHVPSLETNRKNLHPQKKTVIRYSEKNGVPAETRKSAIEKENDQRKTGIFKLINLTN